MTAAPVNCPALQALRMVSGCKSSWSASVAGEKWRGMLTDGGRLMALGLLRGLRGKVLFSLRPDNRAIWISAAAKNARQICQVGQGGRQSDRRILFCRDRFVSCHVARIAQMERIRKRKIALVNYFAKWHNRIMARSPQPRKPLENARPRTTEALRELFAGIPTSELADRIGINQSVVHRDHAGARAVSDLRLSLYLDALPGWSQKSRLLSAWLADALPEHQRAAIKLQNPHGSARVAESAGEAEKIDISGLPIATRAALRALAKAAENDRDFRDWLATTADILTPHEKPDKSKKKGRNYKY